jgi:hypothetical protein
MNTYSTHWPNAAGGHPVITGLSAFANPEYDPGSQWSPLATAIATESHM